MNIGETKLLPAIFVIVVFALAFGLIGFFVAKDMYLPDSAEETFGGVPETQEYNATNTRMMDTESLYKAAEFTHLVATSTGGMTLGSIIVASTTDASMIIYDATSTDAVNDGTLSTQMVRFASSTPVGTYVFDTRFDEGIIIRLEAGYSGDYVLTWRR